MKYLMIAALLLAANPGDPSPAELAKTFGSTVDASGRISLPKDFRAGYAHLGSWFVPEGDASGFHDVYTQAETIGHFRQTGLFPDGAVLIKELRGHQSKPMTTGTPAFATEQTKQWFVMVKDGKNRFPGNPNWGDGWGWALFKPGQEANVSGNYKSDCLGCHIPAKSTDWIYVEGYPSLKP